MSRAMRIPIRCSLPRRCSIVLAALVALLVAVGPRLARADDAPAPIALSLHYVRPLGGTCPDESALHQEVARRMGYDPFTPNAADHLVAETVRVGSGLSSTLTFIDRKGVRRWVKDFAIRDDNCGALVAAMGSHIAYVYAASARPSSVLVPAPPAVLPPSPPPPLPVVPPPPPEPAAARPLFEIGVSPALALGSAPAPAFGLRLQVGARWRPFSIAGELRWDAPASADVQAVPGARITTTLLGGSLLPCGHVSYFMGCALITAGQMNGESAGLSVTKTDASAFVGAGARAGFELKFTENIGARLFAEGLVSIRNVRIVVDHAEAWHTTPVTGSAGATLVAFF